MGSIGAEKTGGIFLENVTGMIYDCEAASAPSERMISAVRPYLPMSSSARVFAVNEKVMKSLPSSVALVTVTYLVISGLKLVVFSIAGVTVPSITAVVFISELWSVVMAKGPSSRKFSIVGGTGFFNTTGTLYVLEKDC